MSPLRDAGGDDEDVVLWLAAPNAALGRRSPVETLDDGDRGLVLDVVRNEAAGVW
ncbi:MAG: antitoxin Xre/MbcA/ParS toxin-binding domain-containing protein [Actinomycetes bacterium]